RRAADVLLATDFGFIARVPDDQGSVLVVRNLFDVAPEDAPRIHTLWFEEQTCLFVQAPDGRVFDQPRPGDPWRVRDAAASAEILRRADDQVTASPSWDATRKGEALAIRVNIGTSRMQPVEFDPARGGFSFDDYRPPGGHQFEGSHGIIFFPSEDARSGPPDLA